MGVVPGRQIVVAGIQHQLCDFSERVVLILGVGMEGEEVFGFAVCDEEQSEEDVHHLLVGVFQAFFRWVA